MKDLCDMTWAELESSVKNSTGIPVPSDGAPREELEEWYVAGVLVIGGKRGGRDRAIQYARDRFDEEPDRDQRARFHDILDRALSGEMESLAAGGMACAQWLRVCPPPPAPGRAEFFLCRPERRDRIACGGFARKGRRRRGAGDQCGTSRSIIGS